MTVWYQLCTYVFHWPELIKPTPHDQFRVETKEEEELWSHFKKKFADFQVSFIQSKLELGILCFVFLSFCSSFCKLKDDIPLNMSKICCCCFLLSGGAFCSFMQLKTEELRGVLSLTCAPYLNSLFLLET